VTITRDGDRLVIEPAGRKEHPLLPWIKEMQKRGPLPPEDRPPEIEELPMQPVYFDKHGILQRMPLSEMQRRARRKRR
jgi:hypothetical protein